VQQISNPPNEYKKRKMYILHAGGVSDGNRIRNHKKDSEVIRDKGTGGSPITCKLPSGTLRAILQA